MKPRLVMAGLVHGRQAEGRPLVFEGSVVLLDKPILVRSGWHDEPAEIQPLAWNLSMSGGWRGNEEEQQRASNSTLDGASECPFCVFLQLVSTVVCSWKVSLFHKMRIAETPRCGNGFRKRAEDM